MEKSTSSPNWIAWGLASICVFLIACNIAIIRRYHWEHQKYLVLQKREVERRQDLKHLALQEISAWQVQIASWALLEEGIELFQRGNHQQTLQLLDQSIEKYAENPVAYYLRGISHTALQEDRAAIEDFSLYLRLVPRSIFGFWRRAQLYYRQQQLTLAKADLEQVLQQKPDFHEAKVLMEQIGKR
jgi:tetratricopeptide (TPR) repeat protein